MAAIKKRYLKSISNDLNQFEYEKPDSTEEAKTNFDRCKVCLDKATGFHYGISSCEGCKVIFL